MMEEPKNRTNRTVYATKMVYKDEYDRTRTILGLIIAEDENFFKFKTRNNIFALNKNNVLSYSQTTQIFIEN